MDSQYIMTVVGSGFAVALAHAAIPTHWLPFVLAGRAQHWSRSRTLGVIAVAGGAHIVFTTLLGALIVWFGIRISHDVGDMFLTIASGALIAVGLYYIARHLRGGGREHHHSLSRLWDGADHAHDHGHAHGHDHAVGHGHAGDHGHVGDHESGDHGHAGDHEAGGAGTDRVAVGSLVAMLTFSPCESFLPVYLSGVPYGWQGFALLSVTLAVATLGSMLLLAWVASLGIERIKLEFLERWEHLIVGSLLCILGIVVYVYEH